MIDCLFHSEVVLYLNCTKAILASRDKIIGALEFHSFAKQGGNLIKNTEPCLRQGAVHKLTSEALKIDPTTVVRQ